MPYVLLETPLADATVEIRRGLSGRYINLRARDAEWVLRFARDEDAAEFARLITA
jgi:hypothetical protein